ncbi:RagB/SusD family nutrient uptake outer membrane protein [Paraflavitalea sp. CAU 1676]|uniref:RagB/SusD family nutrient uptake outer membrane protein n=1 Tax=Paraflavitalea sp. CAU 1676 TaxID=3032598 RepID=UPI0023DA5547|nr:RagB/SusD family nutrient uptake outer membrane protein [Paraflavitalea sp. CAU 1676]MDF2191838.1 RagB/SusD family nutrient uptake outer membrane protein [Paraflavitalea sp. CAU 1676]
MKKLITITSIAIATSLTGCLKDDSFLQKSPTDVFSEEQMWSDPTVTITWLGNAYSRYYDIETVEDWQTMVNFNDAFPSDNGVYWRVQNSEWGYGEWGSWDYGYIRDLNLFIKKCTAAEKLKESDRNRFVAEARFLRASYYFELVKRMGGVPLLLEPEQYDFGGDPTYLQHPRAKESAIYDFVISEAEAIKDILPTSTAEKGRATKGAALAMQARAALYAGSIAKYGVNTPSVTLPGGEVGIPAEKASAYYQKALQVAKDIIEGKAGEYTLYKEKQGDLVENFAALFTSKSNNKEAIFVEDYKLQSGKVHPYTIQNQPRYTAEEQEGGRINPSLNLALQFEKLDNTFAPFVTKNGSDYAYYNTPSEIFAGRDARLGGTILLPGTLFKGKPVDIWAGLQLPDGSVVTSSNPGGTQKINNVDYQAVGFDGPINGYAFSAQTGFYVRKYLDPTTGSGQRGVQSDVWFIRYRLGEIYLIAAEAAFELTEKATAATYLNTLRARAGLTTPLTAADVTFDRIVHERRVELAFEGHTLFDMKRWRLAHIVWDGNPITAAELNTNLGVASKRNTQPWGLWPYKIHDPGNPNHGKWIFKEVLPNRVNASDRFRFGNYYSFIGDNVISRNPQIIRNPNQ